MGVLQNFTPTRRSYSQRMRTARIYCSWRFAVYFTDHLASFRKQERETEGGKEQKRKEKTAKKNRMREKWARSGRYENGFLFWNFGMVSLLVLRLRLKAFHLVCVRMLQTPQDVAKVPVE